MCTFTIVQLTAIGTMLINFIHSTVEIKFPNITILSIFTIHLNSFLCVFNSLHYCNSEVTAFYTIS